MINYSLARKLKDAGWTKETFWFYGSNETDIPCLTFEYNCFDTCGGKITEKGLEKTVLAYAPTLEELIEACGNGFKSLENQRLFPEGHKNRWFAFSGISEEEEGFGSTPSENLVPCPPSRNVGNL